MDKAYQRESLLMVKDLETLKVLTDPLRMEILQILDPFPQTVNQVAEMLGLAGSRLYYHFNLLEEHGFIKVVETRMVNNMMEKLFWVTVENIEIDKDLLNFSSESGQENIIQMIESALQSLREDILRSLQSRRAYLDRGGQPQPHEMIMNHIKKRVKQEVYEDFTKKLKDLIQTFSDLPEETDPAQDIKTYGLACYLYPSFYYSDDLQNKQGK